MAKARKAQTTKGDISATTRVVGIFGDPVEHSLSPAMHNAAFRALGLDYVYVAMRPDRRSIGAAVAAVRALGMVGVNVTVPFKQEVIEHLDRVSAVVKAAGAVNTIVLRGKLLCGENTDVPGFDAALRAHRVGIRGTRVLLIGAGGAARGVVHALFGAGVAEIVIANRTHARGRELARAFPRAPGRIHLAGLDALGDAATLASCRLVVNSTSVGLEGDKYLAYDAGATPADCTHFDLAYRKGLTPFLEVARRARRPIVDGRHMLLHQGAIAFRHFTGRPAPLAVMADAIGITPVRAR
jgi:shikimate dehydrogenase